MAPRLAYVSMGRLYLKTGEQPPADYESPFVQGIRDRASQLYRRHAWKASAEENKMIPRAALWGANPRDPHLVRVDFGYVCPRGQGDGFLYSIVTPEISGVLALKEDSGAELRLLHTADFRVLQVASQPETGRVAMSVHHHQCTVLATMEGDGGGLTEVTQGDSFDESPSWIPGKNHVVYQSAGVATNEHGREVGLSPYAIKLLDLDSCQVSTVLADPDHDLLAPRYAENGSLYFIRRPYRLSQVQFSFWRTCEDIILFPYRLLYAFFQFLNFFSMMYTGKPLSQSGPLLNKQADQARMTLWGNLVEAQKSVFGNQKDGAGLVPPSWELCVKEASGAVKVLAKSVLSFDIDAQGGVLFTNGSAIYRSTAAGERVLVLKAPMIRQVTALPPAPRFAESADSVGNVETRGAETVSNQQPD